jgi:hypothetical protein
VPGALLFVRYAYPPNALGYCGPPDSDAFRDYGRTGVVDGELTRLARSFDGAWPYLELIAGRAGIGDPLDRRVVEAYWVGNRLLDAVAVGDGVAHHSFHVLCGYPWAGMLTDHRKAGRALTVLDQCRVRWGRVTALRGDEVMVRCRPLTWDGRRLDLGRPVTQVAGTSMISPTELAIGDWVSLHWHWVCDRLSDRQVRALRSYTARHLGLVNGRAVHRADRTELSGRHLDRGP